MKSRNPPPPRVPPRAPAPPPLSRPDRGIGGAAPAGDEVAQARLVPDVLAREHLPGAPSGEGARGVKFAGLLDAEQEPPDVGVLAKEVWVDERGSLRVGAGQPHPAA